MTIFEHIKQQHAEMKDKPRKERWEYFWDYYKWHALAVILAVVLLIQGVVGIINKKEIVFSGVLLNCMIDVKDDAFLDGFYKHAGINSKKQTAAFYKDIVITGENPHSDAPAFQRIMAGIATKDTDFVVGQTENFRMCAYSTSRIFIDLREFLDEETLEKLSGRLYYIDGAVLEKLSVPAGQVQDTDIQYPNPSNPKNMKDPIPVGIDISDRKNFQEAYYFPNTELYLGVVANASRPELTKAFISYLFP